MKQQFKVGDSVRLKKNLKVGKEYRMMSMRSSMKFEGSKKIRGVSTSENLLLESWPYYYSPEMLIKEKP